MKLYDTLIGKKKAFKPLHAKRVDLFVCGPTVYDYSHIGHARTYIVFDAFTKYLQSLGYTVNYIQNITDIDDKIIARSRELGKTPRELATFFEKEYSKDMQNLGITSVHTYARATDYIPQIIRQVEQLHQSGYAYKAADGMYYDVSKFKNYGKLSRRTALGAEDSISRIDESTHKKNKGDFALWKMQKIKDEPAWDSPWGKGRPGWHIEDTAITETKLGEQYDIHGGARDLVFPHHEAEIAQMEAISHKKPLANHWMHTGLLTIEGKKMSKSLGNFITIYEFLRKHSKEALRLFVLSSHYRSPVDYNERAVEQAETNAKRLKEFRDKIEKLTSPPSIPPLLTKERGGEGEVLSRHRDHLFAELDDDFNTPKALAALFELVRKGNSRMSQNSIRPEEACQILDFLTNVNKIFGIIPEKKYETIPQDILDLAEKREQLRERGDWLEADILRTEIENKGYIIKDTPKGPLVNKIA